LITGGLDSEFLEYLLRNALQMGPGGRLPSLNEISAETGVSVGKLREQLQVARMLGLVEISPRRGIRLLPYNFLPAVRLGLMIALSLDCDAFHQYSVLRIHLETAFWDEAVSLLTEADRNDLMTLVERAQLKLSQERIQIPHQEHRAFHLAIYSRLHNPFVLGLLEAYWDGYEAVELNTYTDYGYLQEVWNYHARIAEALVRGDYALGKQLLIAHMALIDRVGHTHELPGGRRSSKNESRLAISEMAR
jgi:DNA-binding FadR family transcriptional regulator